MATFLHDPMPNGMTPDEAQEHFAVPGDAFAIYQLRNIPETHELRFESMERLKQSAYMLRNAVHELVEKTNEMLFADKTAIEKHLQSEGFTLRPNDDPGRITVINNMQMTSEIFITYGNDCCWMDGCNTQGVDLMVNPANYEMLYAGALMTEEYKGDIPALLENLYMTFNINRPDDFAGHSLSVSDVIALRINDAVSFHYTDSFGFVEIPDFGLVQEMVYVLKADEPLPDDNNPLWAALQREQINDTRTIQRPEPYDYLRNAEMQLEDDYGMIDGIINNGTKETEAKPSIKEQLQEAAKEIAALPKAPADKKHPGKDTSR